MTIAELKNMRTYVRKVENALDDVKADLDPWSGKWNAMTLSEDTKENLFLICQKTEELSELFWSLKENLADEIVDEADRIARQYEKKNA